MGEATGRANLIQLRALDALAAEGAYHCSRGTSSRLHLASGEITELDMPARHDQAFPHAGAGWPRPDKPTRSNSVA